MSARGRALFDAYAAKRLRHPDLAALNVESHVDNLVSDAATARVPISEIVEEVGPLLQAIAFSIVIRN